MLYAGIHALPWEDHLAPDGTLAVEFTGTGSGIDHSHYGAQRVKDAVVDRFRAQCGQRPGADRQQPDLRIQAFCCTTSKPQSTSIYRDSCTGAATAKRP